MDETGIKMCCVHTSTPRGTETLRTAHLDQQKEDPSSHGCPFSDDLTVVTGNKAASLAVRSTHLPVSSTGASDWPTAVLFLTCWFSV